jgi:glycerophosphoryl diester phosphodiesterase
LADPAAPGRIIVHWPSLAGFSLAFRLIEGVLFLPVAALAGSWLAGTTVVESTALVAFLLSPRGVFLALAGATLFFALRWFEHAGLAAILFEAAEGRALRALGAVRLVLARLPALVDAAARLVLMGLARLAPLLAVTGLAAALLLRSHDINYYLKLRPPEALAAAVAILAAAAVSLALLMALAARARLVVEVILFEDRGGIAALKRSAELTRGIRARVALAALGLAALTVLLGAFAAMLGAAVARPLLGLLADMRTPLLVAFAGLILLRSALSLAATWVVSLLDAAVFTRLYRRRAGVDAPAPLRVGPSGAAPALRRPVPALLVLAGVVGLATAGGGLDAALGLVARDRGFTVHAHRGTVGPAPENSIAAFEAAVRLGADYVETDVQLTRDGTLVLAHDADLARVAGVPRRIASLSAAEVARIRLHGGAPLATLPQALAAMKGKAGVNIELKRYGDSPAGLEAAVVNAVRAAGMERSVVIQSFERAHLEEVARLAPDIPTGFLISVPAGSPFALGVDFLSVERRRIDRRFVARAHQSGKQLFVWTVSGEAELRRQLELGVDGVITDDVATAVRMRREWAALDPRTRTLDRMERLLAR